MKLKLKQSLMGLLGASLIFCYVANLSYAVAAEAVKGPLAEKSEADVPALIQALKASDMGTRWNAALLLGELQAKSALPALVECAENDQNARVRRRAIEALGKLGDPAALPVLLTALKDEEHFVRRDAARALGALKDASAVPALIALLGDTEGFVRRDAARALGELGDSSAVPALQTLTQESPEAYSKECPLADEEMSPVAREAYFALGKLGGETALPALETVLKFAGSPVPVRTRALAALSLLGAPAASILTATLEDPELEVRQAAIMGLQQLGIDGKPGLLQALKAQDAQTQYATIDALKALNDVTAVPLLRTRAAELKAENPGNRVVRAMLNAAQMIESNQQTTP